MVHQLTKDQARRIAVRAQLLDAIRPTDLVSLVEMYKPAAARRWGYYALPILTRIGWWEGRRRRRPQDIGVAGQRHPRRRQIHPRHKGSRAR
jgi:uncharacterized protein YcaQ